MSLVYDRLHVPAINSNSHYFHRRIQTGIRPREIKSYTEAQTSQSKSLCVLVARAEKRGGSPFLRQAARNREVLFRSIFRF